MKNSIKRIQSESLLSTLLSARILRKAKTYKYIALAALALGFTACSQDEDFTPQQEDIVQIASANIATEVQTRVNTLGDGTLFENADQILLVNGSRTSKNNGTYTYDGTNWNLTTGTILYASSGTNDFTAYYPASVDFTLPTDQSDEAKIKSADRMVATTNGVSKGTAVALSFERQNAKITITPTINTQYEDKTISDITDFKIGEITPYLPVNGTAYTAILEPSETGFTVTLKVGQDELTAESSTKIEAGNHYTFSLTVGKEAVKIADVSVTPWTEKTIDDVETDERLEVSTPDGLKDALAKGGNIILVGDIAFGEEHTFGLDITKNTRINLNGHTITAKYGVLTVYEKKILTVVGDGTIKIEETGSSNAINVWEGGTVNLLGGTIEGELSVDEASTANVYGGKIDELVVYEESIATVYGGKIDELIVHEECIATVYGGHVNNIGRIRGTLIITGGTFGEDPTDYLAEGYTATEADGIWTVAPSNN